MLDLPVEALDGVVGPDLGPEIDESLLQGVPIRENSTNTYMTGLEKSFGSLKVLKGITFRIDDGEVGVIIGPSGTGKSTLLRCINFIEKPDGGSIKIGDLSVDAGTSSERQIRRLRNKILLILKLKQLL